MSTSSDSYAIDYVAQTPSDSVLTSTPISKQHEAAHDPHVRTRVLTEAEAIDIARQVAGLLFEELQCGGLSADVVDPWLSGACCLAAAITALVLEHRGFSAVIAGGATDPAHSARITHWWAHNTSHGWIIDPTHGQFTWQIAPLVAHVSKPEAQQIRTLWTYPVAEFMRWRGHPTVPAENKATVDRILTRMTGVPYAWE